MPTESGPTRLAFCITDLDSGGAERALVQLVTRLDRAAWQPSVFCLSGSGPLVDDLTRADVSVTCLGARTRRNLSVVPRLAKQLRQLKPALLQTFLHHANIVGRVAGRLAGVPAVVSGIRVAEKRGRTPLLLDRLTQRLVDRHVCVSQGVARFSIEQGRLDSKKVEVIPNGVDCEIHQSASRADLTQFGIPPNSQTAIFVGRLDPQKDPLLLLDAMKRVAADYPDLHLLIVGDGPLHDELLRKLNALQLTDRVHLIGRRQDVPSLLKSCQFLVLPSQWEGMPNVVLEAMASGLPVIATSIEGTTELIRHSENGLLVSPGSVEEIKAMMSRLLQNPAEAQTLGTAAQATVADEFTWDTMVDRYCALYRSILDD